MKICHLVGAGDFAPGLFHPDQDDCVIACDAGLSHLENIGVTPDLTVGDFDSYGATPQGGETIVLPREKDETDAAYAAKVAFRQGYRRFLLHGALGGARLSHGVANLLLAADIAGRGALVALAGKDILARIVCAGEEWSLRHFPGYFSLFACAGACRLTVRGAKYPFDGVLSPTDALGVSNETLPQGTLLRVSSGKALVILEASESVLVPVLGDLFAKKE